MPVAAAMSRVVVAAKPWLRNRAAAVANKAERRLPSSRSSKVLRGRPRGRTSALGVVRGLDRAAAGAGMAAGDRLLARDWLERLVFDATGALPAAVTSRR